MSTQKFQMGREVESFYKAILGVDTSQFASITGSYGELEIKVDKTMPFIDFLQENSFPATIEVVSTKNRLDSYTEKAPEVFAKLFSSLYLDVKRMWALVRYEEKPVGISCIALMHNGYPNYISCEELAYNPVEVIKNMGSLFETLKDAKMEDICVPPHQHMFAEARLHPDFIKKYKIYDSKTRERIR